MATKKKVPVKKSVVKKKSTAISDAEVEKILVNVHQYSKQLTKQHLEAVKISTGEILVSDVEYCMELSDRILAYSVKNKANTLQPALYSQY